MTAERLAALRAELERRGVIKPRAPELDGYDSDDDVRKMFELCYDVIKKRMAAGGPGWEPDKK